MLVRDTDRGKELMVQIENLRKLIMAYRQGLIKERKKDYEIKDLSLSFIAHISSDL